MRFLDTPFRVFALCVALIGVVLPARSAPLTLEQLEAFDLGLGESGALVQACFHVHAWRAAFPEEQARLVILDEGWETKGAVRRAAAVYTSQGLVRARDFRGPARTLQGLSAADLGNSALLRAKLLELPRVPQQPEEREEDQILPQAQMRLSRHPQGFGFPAVIAGLQSKVRDAEGAPTTVVMPWFVCDFEGLHCLYRPGSGGTTVVRLPLNPVTGQPHVCVPWADVPEALVMHHELQAQRPGEPVELFLNLDALSTASVGDSAVLYSEGGKRRLYNHFLGAMDCPKLAKEPEPLRQLGPVLQQQLMQAYQNAFFAKRKSRILTPPRYGDLYNYLGPKSPEAFVGDTAQLQILRLHQRLLRAGLSPELIAKEHAQAGYQLTVQIAGRSFSYQPNRGMFLVKAASKSETGIDVRLNAPERAQGNRAMPKIVDRNAGRATAFVADEGFVKHLEEQIEKGNVNAARELAEVLLEGKAVKKDVPRARALLGAAADKGDGEAALIFARHLSKEALDAEGTARLLSLYEVAARAGFREAQYNFGAMTASGRGCKRDYVVGLAWLIVAGKNGMEGGGETEIRAALSRKPELIAEAEGRATEIILKLREAGLLAR